MSSLYGQYIKERENIEIVETEQGFATYFYINQGVYIKDLYVHPDHRHSGAASNIADSIVKIAKEKGYNKLYGSIVPSLNGSTEGLKVLLAYGFRLDSAEHNAIIMRKDI